MLDRFGVEPSDLVVYGLIIAVTVALSAVFSKSERIRSVRWQVWYIWYCFGTLADLFTTYSAIMKFKTVEIEANIIVRYLSKTIGVMPTFIFYGGGLSLLFLLIAIKMSRKPKWNETIRFFFFALASFRFLAAISNSFFIWIAQ